MTSRVFKTASALHYEFCSPMGCRCKPTLRVSEATPENLAAAAAAEAQWRKESIS